MKNTNSFSSVAAKAFARDKFGNEYTGEALFMAILLHCSGGDRTPEGEKEIAEMLDDVNIKADKQRKRKRK
jgi:hypothetical protein